MKPIKGKSYVLRSFEKKEDVGVITFPHGKLAKLRGCEDAGVLEFVAHPQRRTGEERDGRFIERVVALKPTDSHYERDVLLELSSLFGLKARKV